MDWSRAKTYLIVTFFLLDLVLGFQYWKVRTEQASYVQSFTEQLTEVRELLASQKWELRTEVPKATPELGFLKVRYLSLPKEDWSRRISVPKLYYAGPGQVSVELAEKNLSASPDEDKPGEKVMTQLAFHIWPREIYQFDRIRKENKGSGVIQYLQVYKNYPIFSASLEVEVQSEKVTRYHQTALEVVGEGEAKKQVISALHALRSLFESMDKSEKRTDNRVIQEIRIGYNSKPFNADEWYLIPMWRILTDKEVYYVNALTGEVEMAR
ncbi:two-component system regulatory protein YycI [Effusibacillus consociatus]|uniref:Two-component system regulatory protein YycI n=1 Tax=Effusibacillus consociatus TaxID=1117041 RepID=A0ABV9Q1M5_9BACL